VAGISGHGDGRGPSRAALGWLTGRTLLDERLRQYGSRNEAARHSLLDNVNVIDVVLAEVSEQFVGEDTLRSLMRGVLVKARYELIAPPRVPLRQKGCTGHDSERRSAEADENLL